MQRNVEASGQTSGDVCRIVAYAEALRKKRKEKNVSLRVLETRTKEIDLEGRGVSVAHLHRVEKGKSHLTVPQVFLVIRALGIPLHELLPDVGLQLRSCTDKLGELLQPERANPLTSIIRAPQPYQGLGHQLADRLRAIRDELVSMAE